MKVAIVGSRAFQALELVKEYVESLPVDTIIITGGARGVDKTAETTAKAQMMSVILYLPDWDKFGRGAGLKRNSQIVAECDKLVAFWDGKSRGTMDSVNKAKLAGKPTIVVEVQLAGIGRG